MSFFCKNKVFFKNFTFYPRKHLTFGKYWNILQQNGNFWNKTDEGFIVISFCGIEQCRVDGAGRVRLPQKLADDFSRQCKGEVVLYGLPEGAVAIYPEEVYAEMRRRELSDLDSVGASFTARRSLRRFGAMAVQTTVSNQGRVTVPDVLRSYAGLAPGSTVRIIGVEIGVEIWAEDRFAAEMKDIHEQQQAERRAEIEKRKSNGGNIDEKE